MFGFLTAPMRTENWLDEIRARPLIMMAFTEEPRSEKPIDVLRRRDGTLQIHQGSNRIIISDPQKLSALIEQLKTSRAIMTSPLYARLIHELERER